MAEAIISFVSEKLSDAAVKEVLLLHGVGKQVERLSRELRWIQAFLKDADMKQIVNETQKNWVNEVRDIAYDIEDVIDNAVFLKAPVTGSSSREHPRGWAQIIGAKRMWNEAIKLPGLHNLADEMNEILARIQEVDESRKRYGIKSLGEGSGERLRLPVRPPVLPEIDDPDVVGFDSDRDNVVNQLLDTSIKRRTVISIVGPGGLGKTTLARKVYNSNDVKTQFDVCIWVVISQEFNLIHILRKIIVQVEPPPQIGEQVEPLPRINLEDEEGYLLTKLYKTLNGEMYTVEDYLHPKSQAGKKPPPKKYLLVLDDIWNNDLWTKISGVLPDAKIGSRVIVTTRIQNIIDGSEPYNLSYLTEEPSLELLFKKALPNRDLSKGCPSELYEVGKEFVKKCGGLPLALSVLGGLLSKKIANYVVWSKMLQTMNWNTIGKECTEIMATSYNDLPFVLKSCFMYFAAFPEDYEIDAKQLVRLWVAEGFIPAEESRTLEDTGESFLEDLVQRSLIQVSKRSPAGSIIICRIHDLLREIAIQKAKENNFLTIFSNPDDRKSNVKARRVAVHYSGCDELMEHANPNLRSLLCFENPLPNCSRQRLLKVLSGMGRSDNSVDCECFHGLNQLRYCQLSGYLINETSFKSFISGLKFVETLDFEQLHGEYNLPDDIWNVKTLRHVMLFFRATRLSSYANLKNLQTLRGVLSRESWNTQLPKLPNVRDLHIYGENSFSWDVISKLLNTLNHLTCLTLEGEEVPQNIVEMQRFPFPFYGHLQSLTLYDWAFPPANKLSLEVGMFPIHVMELELRRLRYKEDPLRVLEKLRYLRVLRLIGDVKDPIQKMSCSTGGFQQLHELELYGLQNLAEWEIKTDAMPIIKVVKLTHCGKLRVPLGLQYLSNLKELVVYRCPDLEFHEDEIRNDICKHVPHISISK